MIKEYYNLAKPRMVYGNAIVAACGFIFASKGHIDFLLLVPVLIGLSLVMASACVFNNYIDRDIDKKMARTKERALAKKLVTEEHALMYGIFLGSIGFIILGLYANMYAFAISLIGIFFYVVVYGIAKRHSIHGALIGTISGAVPPVIGYCAVSNNFDAGSLLLFLILVFWQMPHFFSIAIFRLDDYAAASIPVLPAKKGMYITKITMLLYIIVFTLTAPLLTVFGYTGYTYMVIAIVLGLSWFAFCIQGFKTKDNKRWARKMFFLSLVVLLVLFFTIAADVFLQ
jgi:protoheme IX farnesyltransferase